MILILYSVFHTVCHVRRLEESEKKRQAMMQSLKDQASKKGPNFTITKKDLSVGIEVSTLKSSVSSLIFLIDWRPI